MMEEPEDRLQEACIKRQALLAGDWPNSPTNPREELQKDAPSCLIVAMLDSLTVSREGLQTEVQLTRNPTLKEKAVWTSRHCTVYKGPCKGWAVEQVPAKTTERRPGTKGLVLNS